MSELVELIAADNHELSGYVARPTGEVKGALVVVQEIFGVNAHIKSVTDSYAKEGYLSIAPFMFDRYERNVDLNYDADGMKQAFALAKQINMDFALADVQAAIDWLESETHSAIGVVGFCFGGTVAWLSACRLPVRAAVVYYGGDVPKFADEKPQCPVMLHYGQLDEYIPLSVVNTIEAKHPGIPLFTYEGAGHAFNRDADPKVYRSVAAHEARKRTLRFLQQHLAF